MLNTLEPNVTLSSKQLSSIEVTKQRLSNLENEIVIARKNLGILKKDTIKTIEANKYDQSLGKGLSEEILVKKKDLESLVSSIKASEKISQSVSQKNVARGLELDTKNSELAEKEMDLVIVENSNKDAREELDKQLQSVEVDRKKIDNALKEFAKIKWI